jgi:hypothetical protein
MYPMAYPTSVETGSRKASAVYSLTIAMKDFGRFIYVLRSIVFFARRDDFEAATGSGNKVWARRGAANPGCSRLSALPPAEPD